MKLRPCRVFRLLEALEADSRVDRLFCSFYENDSMTAPPIFWIHGYRSRTGVLQSECLGAPRERGREITRTTRMAKARNKALAGFGDEPLDWLVVIDADLHAQPCHIWQLIDKDWQKWSWPVPVPCKNVPTSLGAAPGAITTATPCSIGTTGWGSPEL